MDKAPAAPLMDAFALREAIVSDYGRFAGSFARIHDPDIRASVDAVYRDGKFWPEPLIQLNPAFEVTSSVDRLAKQNALDDRCCAVFADTVADGRRVPMRLYSHQAAAVVRANLGASYVVTSGTGSGKSMCYFLPIVNAVLRERRAQPMGPRRTRAIVIYPMNALVNSQLDEINKRLSASGLPDGLRPEVRKYTGNESFEARRAVADSPPDILLTNFMMLEMLLTRGETLDRQVVGNCDLQFLVLDELHTYRGRQGADVALLVQRVRQSMCRTPGTSLQCIGTSATMVSAGETLEAGRATAAVASKLFGTEVHQSNVIAEQLARRTDQEKDIVLVRPHLGAAVDANVSQALSGIELAQHPLAVWIELTLGLRQQKGGGFVRAAPRTLSDAARALAADAARPEPACRAAVQNFLLAASGSATPPSALAAPPAALFAFKLHQFISGARHLYATLEPPPFRTITVEGQLYAPEATHAPAGTRRLYATFFCFECGHAYHPVRCEPGAIASESQFVPRDLDDLPVDPGDAESTDPYLAGQVSAPAAVAQAGFVTLHPPPDATPGSEPFDFDGSLESLPESWLEATSKGHEQVRSHLKHCIPYEVRVAATGATTTTGTRAWFLPGRFRFCLRCKVAYSGPGRDGLRLAALSAEGRTSATSLVVGRILRWMHSRAAGVEPFDRKLLAFTDNRQDASLQAGHFNDTNNLILLRATAWEALRRSGPAGVGAESIGAAMVEVLRAAWPPRPWLRQPDTAAAGVLREADAACASVLGLRLLADQANGWRFTNPNLRRVDMMRITYRHAEELTASSTAWQRIEGSGGALLRDARPSVVRAVLQTLLDHMLEGFAVTTASLEGAHLQPLVESSQRLLRAPWCLDFDEAFDTRHLVLSVPPKISRHEADRLLRGGPRSKLGRKLRDSNLWGSDAIRDVSGEDMALLVAGMLRAATQYGLVREESLAPGLTGYALLAGCMQLHAHEPQEATGRAYASYFRGLYAESAQGLTAMAGGSAAGAPSLLGFEAREHTAQVTGEERQRREQRFKYRAEDRAALEQGDGPQEASGFLPVLFCSPTMELGIDISALSVVYLRNVPPTPANYAQRAGRAGRAGQSALVLTYCSAQSPHDQYFFADPPAMVHGAVRAPTLDLANEDMVRGHLHAIWLGCVEAPAGHGGSSGERGMRFPLDLVDDTVPGLPVRADWRAAFLAAEASARPQQRAFLTALAPRLGAAEAPWFSTPDAFTEDVLREAPGRLDSSLDRWRAQLEAARRQRKAANFALEHRALHNHGSRELKDLRNQAERQIDLLTPHPADILRTEYYIYRYLAAENFLPGYNFPRLPVMAFLPGTGAKASSGGSYMARPRFLAVSEFGPHSLIYHEGRAFRVERVTLDADTAPTSQAGLERLGTKLLRLCRRCGYGTFGDADSLCAGCAQPLDQPDEVGGLLTFREVGTRARERISANDEARQRQGFDIQTTFEWAIRHNKPDCETAKVSTASGELLSALAYGATATLTRFNRGLRRRDLAGPPGFLIDPSRGTWVASDAKKGKAQGKSNVPEGRRERVVPAVQESQNVLWMQPSCPQATERTLPTLQHALLRALHLHFGLEEGELQAEPMPSAAARSGFLLHETSQGGAGVLRRLIRDRTALAAVAHRALEVIHLVADVDGGPRRDVAPGCVAGCYRCVLSYFNQPEHALIDRRDPAAVHLLAQLALPTTRIEVAGFLMADPAKAVTEGAQGEQRDTDLTRPDGVDAALRAALRQYVLPEPDPQPLRRGEASFPYAWREHRVVVDATDNGEAAAALAQMSDEGFEVVSLRPAERAAWEAGLSRLAKLLGSQS